MSGLRGPPSLHRAGSSAAQPGPPQRSRSPLQGRKGPHLRAELGAQRTRRDDTVTSVPPIPRMKQPCACGLSSMPSLPLASPLPPSISLPPPSAASSLPFPLFPFFLSKRNHGKKQSEIPCPREGLAESRGLVPEVKPQRGRRARPREVAGVLAWAGRKRQVCGEGRPGDQHSGRPSTGSRVPHGSSPGAPQHPAPCP